MSRMRLDARVCVILLALALPLILVSMPLASAKTLKFNSIIYLPGEVPPVPGQPPDFQPGRNADWSGPITGDITGTAYFWEIMTGPDQYRNYVVGKVEHFFEDFLIVFEDGSWIAGYDYGIWNFQTFKYRSEGRVTATSPGLESYVGCKFFEEGHTTDPWAGVPIMGIATGWITVP